MAINQQVGEVIPNESAILIEYVYRPLLFDLQPSLSEPMCERILIHFLQVPMAMVYMNLVSDLPHSITKSIHVIHILASVLFQNPSQR